MTYALRIRPMALAVLAAAAFVVLPARDAVAQTGQLRDYQAQPIEPPRRTATRPLREGVAGLNGDQGVIVEPRFIVEAISFAVVRGPPREAPFRNTLPFSQSIFAVLESDTHRAITRTYAGIRTGDTVTLAATQNCAWSAIDPDGQDNGVWGCDPQGRAGPVQFTIELRNVQLDTGNVFGGFNLCLPGGAPGDLSDCHEGNSGRLFRHTFTYAVSDILIRLDPSCRCFTETASDNEHQVTFRITRVDDGREQPGVLNDPGAFDPVVYRSGTLSTGLNGGFDFDAGALAPAASADFVFSRSGGAFFLTSGGGAKIWAGNATARGYAACYAQRMSANYVTGQISLPAIGSHACYVTSDGRVGELRVANLTVSPLSGNATLELSFTTWQ